MFFIVLALGSFEQLETSMPVATVHREYCIHVLFTDGWTWLATVYAPTVLSVIRSLALSLPAVLQIRTQSGKFPSEFYRVLESVQCKDARNTRFLLWLPCGFICSHGNTATAGRFSSTKWNEHTQGSTGYCTYMLQGQNRRTRDVARTGNKYSERGVSNRWHGALESINLMNAIHGSRRYV